MVITQFIGSMDENLKGLTWLTDSREARWTAEWLDFYDEQNDFLYFTAARSAAVGDDETTEQHKRQIFRVKGLRPGSNSFNSKYTS